MENRRVPWPNPAHRWARRPRTLALPRKRSGRQLLEVAQHPAAARSALQRHGPSQPPHQSCEAGRHRRRGGRSRSSQQDRTGVDRSGRSCGSLEPRFAAQRD
eukprot:2375758-Pyramimonas_sp.AAC.1